MAEFEVTDTETWSVPSERTTDAATYAELAAQMQRLGIASAVSRLPDHAVPADVKQSAYEHLIGCADTLSAVADRRALAQTVGALVRDDTTLAPLVTKVAQDRDATVRTALLKGLSTRIPGAEIHAHALALTLRTADAIVETSKHLGQLDPQERTNIFEAFIGFSSGVDVDLRRTALVGIRACELPLPSVRQDLAKNWLRDPDPRVVAEAIKTISDIFPPITAHELVTSVMAHKMPGVRAAASLAASRLKGVCAADTQA